MKTFKYNDSDFSLLLPDNWILEREENLLSIYDPENGVGALQLSIYYIEESRKVSLKDELIEFLAARHQSFDVNEQVGYAFCHVNEDGVYWKYWLIQKANIIAFATYNCAMIESNKETELIESIIQSAMLKKSE